MVLPDLRRLFYGLISATNAEQDLDYPEWIDPLNPDMQVWDGHFMGHHMKISFREPVGSHHGSMTVEIPPEPSEDFEWLWRKQISLDFYPDVPGVEGVIVLTWVLNRKQTQERHPMYSEWAETPFGVLEFLVIEYENLDYGR